VSLRVAKDSYALESQSGVKPDCFRLDVREIQEGHEFLDNEVMGKTDADEGIG
jgi:hypothetical protein